MSSTDEHTLARLFSRPMSHNPHWRDIVHMFESLGAGCDGTKKDHLTVKPNGHEMIFPIQYTGVSTPRDNPRDCRDPPISEAVRLSPGRCALSRPITRSLTPGGVVTVPQRASAIGRNPRCRIRMRTDRTRNFRFRPTSRSCGAFYVAWFTAHNPRRGGYRSSAAWNLDRWSEGAGP